MPTRKPQPRLEYQRLFECAPTLLMVLAPDPPTFTILAASDSYLRAVMKQRDEGFIGRPLFEALPVPADSRSETDSRASFLRAIEQRVPDAMVQRHDLVRPESEGGGFEARYWSVVNTPVLGQDGEVLYILHRVEDITELVQAKQQGATSEALQLDVYRRTQEIQDVNRKLRDANAKLADLDRAKTTFFSNVSHEFRTPLTLMLGLLEELLARGQASPDAKEQLEAAQRNAMRLLRLVNSLLDFSRLEAGRLQATYAPTDLAGLTTQLASSFESATRQAGLELRVDCPPLPQPVYVDRDLWEKIVLNLLSNAFKFTRSGEIEVKLRADESWCELSVRDTGVGIPQAELSRIFERFHRVESAGGRSAEGSGIGLALAKELVGLHGGSLQVQSELGRGTTFSVRVPFGSSHLPQERVRAAAPFDQAPGWNGDANKALGWLDGDGRREDRPQSSTEAAAAGERFRVLVADDNADMRAYLSRLLAKRFEVEAVGDGQEALEAARRVRPDLVLSDVMMPRLDGFGLLAAVRADPRLRTLPFILLSARAGEEATGEGLEAGADDYLMKPFSARELVARVTANLRLARAREEVVLAASRAEALEETGRRKNQFLAMLSHELRNPLAPIRNSLYILEKAIPGGDQAKRARQVIDRQVAYLTRMVEDLLEVSRIIQGKLQVQKERLELEELVRGVVEDARPMFERRGIALEADLHGQLVVAGDSTRLAQVVSNLLGNAAKFAHRGGHAKLSLFAEGSDTAVLLVRDDGIGIPGEVLEQLFLPFVQADKTLDRGAGGLGLGLAVVKGFVEAHGGSVSAHSEGPGKGAEFTVRLPLLERAKPRLSLVAPSRPGPRPRRVLIVEDNRDAAHTLKEVLELGGHEVQIAYTGETGVSKARAFHPEVIICDIGLPEMDGYGVARTLRSDPNLQRVCLVAVTGYAALDDAQRSREAGFDHHLPKPPDLGALDGVLRGCRSSEEA